MTDENYEARAQAHLASIKRDMKASMEDAVVRAMHKVMAEFEAKSDERLMEDWGPGPHEVHSLPSREADQPAQRCPLCNYQHGHAIGCKNNPVDIALNKMAENARELGLDYEHPAQKPVALPEKIYEFVPTPEPAKWHHHECEGECIACLIERVVQEAYGSQGLSYLQRHLTSSPAQQEPVAWATQLNEYAHIKWGAKRPEYPMVYEFPLYTSPQPAQQEPVLCINPKVIDPATGKVRNGTGALTYSDEPCAGWSLPLYTSPQAREWVGLTDNEVLDMARTFGAQPWPPGSCVALGQMIEAKLREKNA